MRYAVQAADNMRRIGADMFKSIQDHNTKMMVIGAIKYGRKCGDSDDVIIADAMELFGVTREYVLDLMKTEAA